MSQDKGSVASSDYGPEWVPARKYVTSADVHTTAVDLTDLPTTGSKILLDDLVVSVSTACEVKIVDGNDGTTVLWSAFLAANSPMQFTPRDGLKGATANKKLQLKTDVAAPIRAWAAWHSEA